MNLSSLLKEKSCLEEELLSGERLICLAEDTESRQKEDRIVGINLLNNVHTLNLGLLLNILGR